jgi:oligopeptide transport system permease protein
VGKYIIRRLLQMIPVMIGTTFLIFAMVFAIGDPLSGRCGERPCSAAYAAAFTAQYHLDDPLLVQYGYYMADLLRGDLGVNFFGNKVSDELLTRYPTTITLALMAVAIELVIGVLAGVLTGINRGGFLDNLVLISTLVVISIPIFVIGSLAQLVFGVQLGWFPITATQGSLQQLILPALVLASTSVAYVTRLTRGNLAENLRSDYVRTARAKGLTQGRIVGVHTLRNSLIPVITFVGADLGALMGGAIVTERIFNINGIGNFIFRSSGPRDGTSVVGAVTVLVVIFLLANLLVDILYGFLDPRISND